MRRPQPPPPPPKAVTLLRPPEAPKRELAELVGALREQLGPLWPEEGWRWAGVGRDGGGWYVLLGADFTERELWAVSDVFAAES